FDLAQSGSLTFELAQIEQLGAAHASRADMLNFVDDFGIQREDTLDALSEADFANGDARLRAALMGDHHTLEGLNAFFVAFLNLHLHTDGVAGIEMRKVLALELFSKFCHDRRNRHNEFLSRTSHRLCRAHAGNFYDLPRR